MALIPHGEDKNLDAEMKRYKEDPGSWGAGPRPRNSLHIPDSALDRIARRVVAHYGLSGYAGGRIGLVAQKLLDTAKNDESKVRLDDARAELIEMGFVA